MLDKHILTLSHTHTQTKLCTPIVMYVWRERERDRFLLCTFTQTHTHTHINIYICNIVYLPTLVCVYVSDCVWVCNWGPLRTAVNLVFCFLNRTDYARENDYFFNFLFFSYSSIWYLMFHNFKFTNNTEILYGYKIHD